MTMTGMPVMDIVIERKLTAGFIRRFCFLWHNQADCVIIENRVIVYIG